MKTHRILLSFGALIGALFLSGCMAAMMPAMLLGHHGMLGKKDSAHEPPPKSCECEKPAAAKADAPAAPAEPAGQKPAPTPSSGHKH